MPLIVVVLFGILSSLHCTRAWEWSDFVYKQRTTTIAAETRQTALSIQEVSELRVRDIKRRLTRNHGYSAEEVRKILDKKELIQALAFEEEKLRLQSEGEAKRVVVHQAILATILAVFLVICWPLFQHAYEVAMVNFVVYMDRKKLEAKRCYDLQSPRGMVGVFLMGVLDVLQIWLTLSVILSWVTTSRYFFPTPSLTVRPAQLLMGGLTQGVEGGGGDQSSNSLSNYGINLGSMLVTSIMRFSYSRIQLWTGQVLSKAHRQRRKQQKQSSSDNDESHERKEARRAAKLERQQRQQYHQQLQQRQREAAARQHKQMPPPEWAQYHDNNASIRNSREAPTAVTSESHREFLFQLHEHTANPADKTSDEAINSTSALDELD